MTLVSLSAAATSPVGQWGGDRALLTIDASGGRIDYDCGEGSLRLPIVLDAKGRFSTSGTHQDYLSKPTAIDKQAERQTARYEGVVRGDEMSLAVQVSGETATRNFKLVRGQRVKLFRCL